MLQNQSVYHCSYNIACLVYTLYIFNVQSQVTLLATRVCVCVCVCLCVFRRYVLFWSTNFVLPVKTSWISCPLCIEPTLANCARPRWRPVSRFSNRWSVSVVSVVSAVVSVWVDQLICLNLTVTCSVARGTVRRERCALKILLAIVSAVRNFVKFSTVF